MEGSEKRFYVYAHRRLDTGSIFYIGKGSGRRAHYRHGRNPLWTRIANKHGYEVEIIADGLTEPEAFAIEREAIGASDGLCNFTDGGEGISGYAHTEETKRRLSLAHSGRKQDPQVVEARTEKLRGKKRSPEFSEWLSRLHAGSKRTPEVRAKMSADRMGRKLSPEAIAKTAAWHTGRKRSDESRRRMADAQAKKPVLCVCTGVVFPSISAAAEWLRQNGRDKATKAGIWHCLTGRQRKSYGYEWTYHEPVEPKSERVLRGAGNS